MNTKYEVLNNLYFLSMGVWATSLFITAFYDNPIPMWISLIIMNILFALRNRARICKHE